MNSVKFKITGYDDISNSIIVSFASDTTASQDPAAYAGVALQPLNMWPDVTDITELKKQIARTGMYQAQRQEDEEKFKADPARIAALKELIGQTHEFTVEELTTVDNQTPFATV